MTEQESKPTSRRNFLVQVFMGGGILVAAGTFLKEVWAFLYPDTSKHVYTKFMVAKVKDIPVGRTRHIEVGGVPLHVIHLPEGFKVFSGICTHLGCLVRWEENKKRFYCPCHGGVFSPDGTVLDGPPPRPLDEYKVTIDNEIVFIKVQQRKGRWS